MKILLLVLSLVATPVFAYASPGLVVTGDSWSYLPCFFDSIKNAINERNMDVELMDCLKSTKIGSRAENFKNISAYTETINQLKTFPQIKAVYLSLGGNDMFNHWTKNLSPQEEAQVFLKIKNHIIEIVNDIHAIRPDVFVLINGYDFGYLYDNNPIKPYREIYEHMGKPTPLEVNSGFIRFSKAISEIKLDHTAYIQHQGLMHYYFGVPEAGIEPHKTLPPDKISPPENPMAVGGVITARNNPDAMMRIFNWFIDPHHLSPEGFEYLIGHSIDQYLKNWLK